jgi:UDP-N-acetylglucosamine 2-epimerase (non-hydrolysing)
MKLVAVVGTRPEAIKMAPVVLEARARGCEVCVVSTGQHREMLDQVHDVFGIRPDRDLELMRPDQALAELTARVLVSVDEVMAAERPDWVLVQGDTTTAMAAALCSFYRGTPIGHVESGLRTHDLARPFPEELNRIVADRVSRAHFAPTPGARENLLAEGLADATIHVTGNTVVDALQAILASDAAAAALAELPRIEPRERLVLVTAHRRESFGRPMASIARAVARLARAHPDVRVVLPVHPNPNVRGVMEEILERVDRVHLVPPMSYPAFVKLMARAHLVLTDSGGVQEEAPSLGVPALVLRETTERPEAVAAGAIALVGLDEDAIVAAAERILGSSEVHARMARTVNPYGDGHAAERIVSILRGEPWEPFRA